MNVLYAATATAAAYVLWALVRPFGRCVVCRGTGTRPTLVLRRGVYCRRCDGTGRRVRIVRRVWTWWKAVTPPSPGRH